MNGSTQHVAANTSILPFYPENGVDLRKILQQLYRHIWLILIASACAGLIAVLYTFTIQPKYQSTALMRFKLPSSSNNLFSMGMKSESQTNTQIALMTTRYILEPVIIKNGLNITASPHYFPIFGAWMARRFQENGLANPLFGLNNYAWGGEQIEVKHFSVPSAYLQHNFKLVVGQHNTYQLFSNQEKLILTGKVGEKATSSLLHNFTLEITTLKARPGTTFFISTQSPLEIVKGLSHNLKITNIKGNDPSQETGVEQIQFSDSNPERATQVLNAIIQYTVEKNVQLKTLEFQKTLEFLNQRLPEVKNNLGKTEETINQYHAKMGIVNMSAAGQILTQQLMQLTQAIEKIKSQKEELLQIYTQQHPVIIGLEHKEASLQQNLNKVKMQVKQFPSAHQVEADLTREAKIKNSMYLSLLTNEQQALISKAGLVPDAIVLTDATPAEKMPTHKLLTIIGGFLMGAFLSTIAIILKSAFSKTIDNSEHLEDATQIPVQSVVPYSRKQKQLEKLSTKNINVFNPTQPIPLVLAKREPDDIAIESLRSLRVSLHITSANTQIIALMGSLSNIGKSFVSLNLAQIMADSGKRTLLIDADIRKGRLHKALHQEKTNGLSEYLENKCDYANLIRPIHENLFFISCGSYSTHPIHLFQSARFEDLIQKVKNEFDQIIIDTPPIIPVTDSVLIAQHCDIKLFVVSAAKDTISDVKQAIKKSRAHGISIDGLILNHRKPLQPYGAKYNYRYAYATNSN